MNRRHHSHLIPHPVRIGRIAIGNMMTGRTYRTASLIHMKYTMQNIRLSQLFLQRRPMTMTAGVVEVAERVMPEETRSSHAPPLQPRDEAVFLLTAAAEVEHALMVQYLFAAYSVRTDTHLTGLVKIQESLIQIAREEMGHLATVQNLLLVLGGPLNFRREQSPYASEIYPFRFKLQSATLSSLAKYVIAESPATLPDELSMEDKTLLCDVIEPLAQADNDSVPVQHVGPIFARLLKLFEEGEPGQTIQDEDFFTETLQQHARFEDWGYDPQDPDKGDPLVVSPLEGTTAAEIRAQAIAALREIAEQGEGFEQPGGNEAESHFQRFFAIYKRMDQLTMGGTIPSTWPLPLNPNTTPKPMGKPPGMEKMVAMVLAAHENQGRITEARALAWAQLFNLRYRMLIAFLSHFLRLDSTLYTDDDDNPGDRTPRGLLLIWTFNEMRRLRKIALKLVQIPKDEGGSVNAGPPFELPYTLNLSDLETARWRAHLDISRSAIELVKTQLIASGLPDAEDEFLADLVRLDEEIHPIMSAFARGESIPEDALPKDLQKAAHILEEAVRGFTIGPDPHSNFWDRKDRDDFITKGPFQGRIIHENPDGSFDADKSRLIQLIEKQDPTERMPRFRPPIPPNRIEFLREWITSGCPSDGEVGIAREREIRPEQTEQPKIDDGILGFADDIKPLFRDSPDRDVMIIFGLDLHDFTQVSERADQILERLKDGSMPCDAAWPPERIAKFEKWISDGKQP